MNQITIIDNKVCQVDLDDPIAYSNLRNFLSFRQAGVEYMEVFKNGNWDGITYMINNKRQFPLGLLSKVQEYFNERKITITLTDKRPPYQPVQELDISKKLEELKIKPRDYQQRVVDLSDTHRRGIVRACTSSGKTLMIALMIAKLNKPCIVHVVGLQLLQQFYDTLTQIFDEPIGWIGDGKVDIQRINVASIWTLGSALNINLKDLVNDEEELDEKAFNESDKGKIIQLLKEAPVHFVDECQFIVTSSLRSIYAAINPESLYGFSGTPFREDNTDLLAEGILGPKIVDITATELINKNVIVQPFIDFINVPKIKVPNNYQQVYKTYIVENDDRNLLIVNATANLIQKGLIPLVLFKQIKHGNILADFFKLKGIKFAMLSGKDSLEKRNKIVQDLKDKKIDCILASVVFDIGVNIPEISGLVLAGGGKASGRALQRIGRVIRAFPGKTRAEIIDFWDNCKFLKSHSEKRYETYCSEEGFKVTIPSSK